MMMADYHDLGFEIDRDYFIAVARISRLILCSMGIFIFHPLVIFVVLKKSSMSTDSKVGQICHTMCLFFFDVYNGFLYQLYTLLPLPILICTGFLCAGDIQSTTLLACTMLAFFTVSVVAPNLFLMLRVHQKMLFASSPLKLPTNVQVATLLVLTVVLFSNVFGFHIWTVDIPNKRDLLNRSDVQWLTSYSPKCKTLVLGKGVGDIGIFENELILLILTIVLILPLFVFVTYHAIYKIGNQLGVRNSKAHQAQMRFMYCLAVQSAEACTFFVSPLLLLFIGLYAYKESWNWTAKLGASLRLTFLMFYSVSPLAHSIIFLAWNPWFRETVRSKMKTKPVNSSSTITI